MSWNVNNIKNTVEITKELAYELFNDADANDCRWDFGSPVSDRYRQKTSSGTHVGRTSVRIPITGGTAARAVQRPVWRRLECKYTVNYGMI